MTEHEIVLRRRLSELGDLIAEMMGDCDKMTDWYANIRQIVTGQIALGAEGQHPTDDDIRWIATGQIALGTVQSSGRNPNDIGRIIATADTCGGDPRLAGTRWPVWTAGRFEHAAPDQLTALQEAYPHLDRVDLLAAIAWRQGRAWGAAQRKQRTAERKREKLPRLRDALVEDGQ